MGPEPPPRPPCDDIPADWTHQYAFSLATAFAYIVAAAVIACQAHCLSSKVETHSWALRRWVSRTLLGSCTCRALQSVSYTHLTLPTICSV